MEEIKTTVKIFQWLGSGVQWLSLSGIEQRLDNAAEAATISKSRIYEINSFREWRKKKAVAREQEREQE